MEFPPRGLAPASARLYLVLCLAEKHFRKFTIHPSFSWGVFYQLPRPSGRVPLPEILDTHFTRASEYNPVQSNLSASFSDLTAFKNKP